MSNLMQPGFRHSRPAPAAADSGSVAVPGKAPRHDWTRAEVRALLDLAFPELMFRAQLVHRARFDPTRMQIATLLSIKTGGCPEDCAYCPQSARHEQSVPASRLMRVAQVLDAARQARDAGATRFCMGAAWRSPKEHEIDEVCEMVAGVRALGIESCATLGMLSAGQARRLAASGLDYYNHNLDTSPEHYGAIITTRVYQDRLDTLGHVRDAGVHVCCGGIVGMGEDAEAQAGLLHALATLPRHPESVPINMLVRVAGTPLASSADADPIRFVRIVAAARVLMPHATIRLAAGREGMSDETQALCFLAGASSIFGGARLLTTPNPGGDRDASLLARLGMRSVAAG